MADVSTVGLDELFDDLAAIAELPDTVALEMLRAEAEVVAEAQAAEAAAMLSGEYSTGTTAKSVTYGKKIIVRDGERVLYVYPNGTRKDHGGGRVCERIRKTQPTGEAVHSDGERKSRRPGAPSGGACLRRVS